MSELVAMRAQLANIERSIGKIEGSLGALVKAQSAHTMRADDRHEHLEKRVRKVEGRLYWFTGIGTAIGALIGIGGHKITAG